MSTIPASLFAAVNPSVLAAGGSQLDVIGLILTNGTRVPIGTVAQFATKDAVGDYFGDSSTEKAIADDYFPGFDGAAKLPALIKYAQYNEAAVAAFIRGGDVSSLTLTELKAISGSLNIAVDGYARNASSVNLAASTSFSSAAGIIETALNAAAPTEATFTAALGAAFTGAISTTTLTVSALASGTIKVGDTISGTGVTVGTTITALGTGTGGTGTYTVSVSQTASSTAMIGASNILVVSAVASGTLAVGQTVDSSGTNAVITTLGTGTGGTGTYVINGSPQHIASESMTAIASPVDVSYDSTSGAFIIASTITGAESLVAFATGTISDDLEMTSATGAVLSQGAVAAVPATFMDALIEVDTDWVMFMTGFDPDDADENTVKLAFSAWTSDQNDRYAYICWDLDQAPVAAVPASSSLGALIDDAGYSGTCLLSGDEDTGWDETSAMALAAFVCGCGASIDFTQRNGRITFAYRSQTGQTATVTNETAAVNLGGNPQTDNRGNGYNYYGAVGAANAGFTWFQRGFVSGDFLWLDSYINQIWLNNRFQVSMLTLMGGINSLPYGQPGNSLIEAALADDILAGLNFGAFGPGTMTQAQIAEVNSQAGADISGTLQAQGYYLQILLSPAVIRSARTSPPCKFWYIDDGSIQALTLSSVAVQ